MLSRAQIAVLISAFFSGVSTWLDYRAGYGVLAGFMAGTTVLTLLGFAVMWCAKREMVRELEELRKAHRDQ